MSDQKKVKYSKSVVKPVDKRKLQPLLMVRITVHQLLFKTMKRIQSNQC